MENLECPQGWALWLSRENSRTVKTLPLASQWTVKGSAHWVSWDCWVSPILYPPSTYVDLCPQGQWVMKMGMEEKYSRSKISFLYLLSVPESGIGAMTHLSFGREFRIKSHSLRISGPFLKEWEAQGRGSLVYTAHKALGEPDPKADSWSCPQRFSSQWHHFPHVPDMIPTKGHISKWILNHAAAWRTALKVTFSWIGWVSTPWFYEQALPSVCVCVCDCIFYFQDLLH